MACDNLWRNIIKLILNYDFKKVGRVAQSV
jgi:hypothetical protein